MELAHSLLLNEDALAQITEAKRPVFIFEWLRFLDKVLVAANKVTYAAFGIALLSGFHLRQFVSFSCICMAGGREGETEKAGGTADRTDQQCSWTAYKKTAGQKPCYPLQHRGHFHCFPDFG